MWEISRLMTFLTTVACNGCIIYSENSIRIFYKINNSYSSFLFIQLNAQLYYSRLKLTLKFILKCSCMFRLTNHHQGAYCSALLKLLLLLLLKYSVKIRRYEISSVVWLHIHPVCNRELSLKL